MAYYNPYDHQRRADPAPSRQHAPAIPEDEITRAVNRMVDTPTAAPSPSSSRPAHGPWTSPLLADSKSRVIDKKVMLLMFSMRMDELCNEADAAENALNR